MSTPRPEGLPETKYREMDHKDQAQRDQQAQDRAGLERRHQQNEAEKDRTATREHQSHVESRYGAGHDWVKEWQERTGEIERSR